MILCSINIDLIVIILLIILKPATPGANRVPLTRESISELPPPKPTSAPPVSASAARKATKDGYAKMDPPPEEKASVRSKRRQNVVRKLTLFEL